MNLLTINNINLSEISNESIIPVETENNLDKEVLGGEKISYTGKADISSNIIDTGLEIPTLIHKTAREVLNLEIFDAEICPYLEDIFINQYPKWFRFTCLTWVT